MESFLNRYRNITVLLLVLFAQLVLLAVDAKNDQHVRFIRVWTVTVVSPLARVMEGMRMSSIGFVHNYITLHDADAQNRRLQAEVDRLKLENIFLTNQLNRADNAKALAIFQQRTPSKTIAASVFSTGIGSSRKVVYVDRGSASGVMREMAVITPDGIIGKVTAVYPTASEVLLITDPMFAAGVISGKTHARGTLKGTGNSECKVDFVAFEDKVDPGDWFYTSGDDRIFPRGMPVGVVKSVKPGQPYREIMLEPSAMAAGSPDDVLIVLEGVHQDIPDTPPASQQVYLAPPPPPLPETSAQAAPPADGSAPAPPPAPPLGPGTEADKLRTVYQKAADAEDIVLGGGPTGQNIKRPPDFTKIPVDPRTLPPGRGVVPAPAPAATPSAPPVPKKSAEPPIPTKSTAPTNPDAVRRANQAGGPGGIPQL
ncbi:MAG TPA: rod shape-determining protein MreC [Bryobacteraceae bacterium]|nr:rod shape-determining protein MreC [Bryobacteraceae bacterium]